MVVCGAISLLIQAGFSLISIFFFFESVPEPGNAKKIKCRIEQLSKNKGVVSSGKLKNVILAESSYIPPT